jgi:hypothetical protein
MDNQILVFEEVDLSLAGGIPEADGAIPGCRGDLGAIRAEGHIVRVARVAEQDAVALEQPDVPKQKKSGAIVLERPLPSGTTGVPLTWIVDDRQYGVVATGAQAIPVELVASAMAQARCHESAVLRPFRSVAVRIPILEDIA